MVEKLEEFDYGAEDRGFQSPAGYKVMEKHCQPSRKLIPFQSEKTEGNKPRKMGYIFHLL